MLPQITNQDYNYPFGIPSSYFNQDRAALIPNYTSYNNDYQVHFLRYIYYMCFLGATGNYPQELGYEELVLKIRNQEGCDCKQKIKKILIAEAPNVPSTYFYNSAVPYIGNSQFTTSVKAVLFPNQIFANQVDFLKACANEGFLLLDLFPYALAGGYTSTTSTAYKIACKSAFCGLPYTYTATIISVLTSLLCCINDEIILAFALKRFGDPILLDNSCVTQFTTWLTSNGKTLYPSGTVDIVRALPIPNASNFLRVVGSQGIFGPSPDLLSAAGF